MASHLKALKLILSILLFFDIEYIRGADVFIWNGFIDGTYLTTRNGRKIEAFLGIPYAEPPVGPLRFKPPVEAQPWDGHLVAHTDRSQCPQLHNGVVVGAEDCLYLNVYTPQLLGVETETLFPTMVYIHGGNFVRSNGSSTIIGPEYLLDRDIVLVTLNYRLGPLGFLSTGDWHAPGNFGLKDQVHALRWVQKNIGFFSGDPDKVTLFGHDAGGASAQLHSISDMSAGLFHQYISQSGSSNALIWALVDEMDSKDNTVKLGEHLHCPTTNSEVMVDCLREVDIYSLVNSDDIFGDKWLRFKTWGPTVEPSLSGAFLTMHPYYKIVLDGTHVHRSIIGNVADEGLILTAQYYSDTDVYEKIAENLDTFLHRVVKDFQNLPVIPEKYVDQVKDFYFNGTEISDKETFTKDMTTFISDTFFFQPSDFIARTVIDECNDTVYFYSFDYRGTFSKTSRFIGSNENIGVIHGDELIYLFPTSTDQFELSESDKEILDTMIDLWTSFADTGIPNTKRFSGPNFWKHYGDNRDYLKIGNNSDTSLSSHDNFRKEEMRFWIEQTYLLTIGSYFTNVLGIKGK